MTLIVIGVTYRHNISEHVFDKINVLLMYRVMKMRYSKDVPAQGITGLLKSKTFVYFNTMTYDIQ
jgi:hypothetical protein